MKTLYEGILDDMEDQMTAGDKFNKQYKKMLNELDNMKTICSSTKNWLHKTYSFDPQNYPNISQTDVEKILYAIKNHTVGRNATDAVSACLWDGDRIRLSWERGYKPDFFSTERGRQIASLTANGQRKYISAQEEILTANNIRTRAQIAFDKYQDQKQNQTQYKIHTR